MWRGLVQTKVEKAMVAVKWHKQLDWRPLQYIINILGVGPSEKEEDLTAWLASGYWQVEQCSSIRPNCKTIFYINLFNWSNLRICDISTYKTNIWHMNLTCRNCGQKRGERLQVHVGLLRCTLKRGFATPGCIAPAHMARILPSSKSNHILWIHWIPVTRQERREMVQGRAQETARIALIWHLWKIRYWGSFM